MHRTFAVAGLALLAFLPAAHGKPKSTTFPAVVESSPTIFVAHLSPNPVPNGDELKQVALEVTEVLRGDLKPGRVFVSFEDSPHVGKDGEFVAFLDKGLVWRFAAVPTRDGAAVASSPLRIAGFYDFNAYFVSPSLLTLEQIKTYLKDGSLTYRFSGAVYFPVKGEAGWKEGTVRLEGTFEPLKKTSKVKGLPGPKGLADQPEVTVGGWGANGITLDYTSGKRMLHVEGEVDELDPKTGALTFRFAVTRPDFLTQKEFEGYVSDPTKGEATYRIKLEPAPTKEDPKPKPLTLVREGGRVGTLEGWDNHPLPASGSHSDGRSLEFEFPTDDGRALTVRFVYHPQGEEDPAFHWTFREDLLYELHRGELTGTMALGKDKDVQDLGVFTATLEEVRYAKLEKK
jgi:hypothetical protein